MIRHIDANGYSTFTPDPDPDCDVRVTMSLNGNLVVFTCANRTMIHTSDGGVIELRQIASDVAVP